MNTAAKLLPEILTIDASKAADQIESSIRHCLYKQLKRKGLVLGLSGGIDSSVAAALCIRAVGTERVLGLFMPEAESSPDTPHLARLVADSLGIKTILEDITPILRAARCYQRRDEAIRKVVPEYGEGHKCKIVLPNFLNAPAYPFYSVVVQSPDGVQTRARLTAEAFLGIVAASNFKQRTRKMIEYYHADRLNYAVVGTPNRLEYEQGFFVKNGDGAADIKPIAHLYKTQVYQLAEFLKIPQEIQRRQPTTDTYSLDQSQEEFYFALPYDKMDLCLYARNQGLPASEAGTLTGLKTEEAERIYQLIDSKRNATRYLHMHPLLVESIFRGKS